MEMKEMSGPGCRQHSYSIYHSIQKLKVFSFHEHATAILTSNYCYNIFFNQSHQFLFKKSMESIKKENFSFSLWLMEWIELKEIEELPPP